MTRITLRSLIGKQKDAAPVVAALLDALAAPIGIEDADGRLLAGQPVEAPAVRLPVTLDGQTLGWVTCAAQADAVASLLGHLAAKEAEKKTLGSEVLHLYREPAAPFAISGNTCDADFPSKSIARLIRFAGSSTFDNASAIASNC